MPMLRWQTAKPSGKLSSNHNANGTVFITDIEPRGMSNTAEIEGQVEGIIAERLRVETDAFNDSTEFEGEALDAESLDLVELAEAIEADLGIHIPDDDLAEIDTVGDLNKYVAEHA